MMILPITEVIIDFAEMTKVSKLTEKLLDAARNLPEYVHASPGYPEYVMPIPSKVQFYYRSREESSPMFLHDSYILLYLLDGKVDIEIEQRVFSLLPGQMLLIFPNCAHRTKPLSGCPNHLLQVRFVLSGSRAKDLHVLRNIILPTDSRMRQMLLNMAKDFAENYPEQNNRLNTLVYRFGEFLELLRHRHTPEITVPVVPQELFPIQTARKSEILHRLTSYCMRNLSHKVTIQELAEYLKFSPSNLRLFFRKQTGRSLGTYLRSRRLIQGTYLLRNSGMSIKEIAEQCGYDSAASFCRAYKRESGCSPTEIRSLNKLS